MTTTAASPKPNTLKELFKPYNLQVGKSKLTDEAKLSTDNEGNDYSHKKMKQASVLIPLFYKNGKLHVLLTERSHKLTHCASQVAFPGGMKDEGDKSDTETALRESEEEIGLNPDEVDVIGVFRPGFLHPNSLVTPVLGIIPSDFVPVPNEREVALVFSLPLQRFLSEERLEIRDSADKDVTWHTHHFLDYFEGKEVDTWGFTAYYCIAVALVTFQSEKQFCLVDNYIVTKNNAFPVVQSNNENNDHKWKKKSLL